MTDLLYHLEKIISVDLNLAKLLKITHIWIFSQRKLSLFVHFSPLFTRKTLSFEITRYTLKKEFPGQKKLKSNIQSNVFLFLNNISEKSELGIFLNKNLRKLLPIKKDTQNIIGNFSRCILFDFNPISEILEYRCYLICNNNLIIPINFNNPKKILLIIDKIINNKKFNYNFKIVNRNIKKHKINFNNFLQNFLF